MTDDPTGSDLLVEAILDDELVALLADPRSSGLRPADRIVSDANDCVERISALAGVHASRISLAAGDIAAGGTAVVGQVPGRQQRALVRLDVSNATLDDTRRVLQRLGYEPVDRISAGAWASKRRAHHQARFTSSDGDAVQVIVSWGDGRTARRGRRQRLAPGPRDWNRIDLPAWAWPAYHLLRAGRLGLHAIGRRQFDAPTAPHLPTPTCLVEPVLRFAGVGAEDVLLDLGSGDGRVLVEAASTIGCRGIGIELDDGLVRRSRDNARRAGVADLLEFRRDDMATADVRDATAAFLFLPPRSVPPAIELLGKRLPAGTVIIAHEQARLPMDELPEPIDVAPIFADAALTVASKWMVGD